LVTWSEEILDKMLKLTKEYNERVLLIEEEGKSAEEVVVGRLMSRDI
jgi:hypothetical protein